MRLRYPEFLSSEQVAKKNQKSEEFSVEAAITKTINSNWSRSLIGIEKLKTTPISKATISRPAPLMTPSPRPSTTMSLVPQEGIAELLQNKCQCQLSAIERAVLQTQVDVASILEILRMNQPSRAQDSGPSMFERRFPLRELDDFLELENSLENEDTAKELTDYLRAVGGVSVEDSTRRILVRTFTNELGKEFSWEGRGGTKRSLKNSTLIQLIGRVVRNAHRNTFDLKTFEKKVSEWFRQSGTRIYSKTKNQRPNVLQID